MPDDGVSRYVALVLNIHLRRLLVVEEDTTVLDARGTVLACQSVDGGVLLDGNICPPVPGRNTELLGQFVEAVDGTGNEQTMSNLTRRQWSSQIQSVLTLGDQNQ